MQCATSTRGDKFNVFPGLEAYLNLEHVLAQLEQFEDLNLPVKQTRTLNSVLNFLRTCLEENKSLKEEITALIPEFIKIRDILAKRERKSSQIQKEVRKWTYELQNRLKQRKLEFDPVKIKWQRPSSKLSCEKIWQQWIRLVHSYREGLYAAYDMKELEFTNNAKEQLFHRSKHHFKSLLGRDNVSRVFKNHGALHVQLLDIDFSKESVSDILLACETPLIESKRREFNAQYATIKRTWRIREVDTGNIAKFKANILKLEST